MEFLGQEFKVNYIQGESKVLDFLGNKKFKNFITLDIETFGKDKYIGHPRSGLYPMFSKIRLIQMFDGEEVYILDMLDGENYLPINHEVALKLHDLLHNNTIVAHNALFETSHFYNLFEAHGLKSLFNLECSMIAYRLLAAAKSPEIDVYKVGLARIAKEILDVEISKDEQTSDWSIPELSQSQLDYAAMDTLALVFCMDVFHWELQSYGMEKLFKLNCKMQLPLAQMYCYGVDIDKTSHDKLIQEWEKLRDEAEKECLLLLNKDLLELSEEQVTNLLTLKVTKNGVDTVLDRCEGYKDHVGKESILGFLYNLKSELEIEDPKDRPTRRLIKNLIQMLLNIASPTQLGSWVLENVSQDEIESWPRTPTGKLQMDADAFAEFDYIEELAPIAKFKKYGKLANTYGRGLADYFIKDGERTFLPANFNLALTGTGRLSSSNPNCQNFPRDKEFRKIFTSSKGESVLVADYGQIELRVAALLSGDVTMLEAYDTGTDLHALTASRMARCDISEVTKDQRQKAKGVNFGLLYGAGPDTLMTYCKKSYGVSMDRVEAQEAVETFRETFDGYRAWHLEQAELAESSLSVTTKLGKVRALKPDFTYTTCANTLVQGTAAEIMSLASILIYQRALEFNIPLKLMMIIHDEVVCRCDADYIEQGKEIIKTSMEDAFLMVFPSGSLINLVDVGVANNWEGAKL